MDDAWIEAVVRDLLDGRPIDWAALAHRTPPHDRARLEALRSVGEAAAARRQPTAERARWGAFELIEPTGYGGYGEVWRARDPELDRIVALKIVPVEDESEAEDVLREGRLLARVRHPNVAAVYAATRLDGEVGVAMEFVEGDDLDRMVRATGPFSPGEVVRVGRQLALALDAVHRAGVLHRDIKASNVKCASDGRIVLLDFGSSREQRVHAADAGLEPGTPLYVAPELLRGEQASAQSDLYSLGVLLYYLASGAYPVRAATVDDLRAAHAAVASGHTGRPRAPQGLPRRVRHLLETLLAADPARRPQTAGEVAARLSGRMRTRTLIAGTVGAAAFLSVSIFVARVQQRHAAPDAPGAESARKLTWSVAPIEIGRPSVDGRILPFADRRSGALAAMTIATGAIQDLTPRADIANGYAGYSVASPDGSTIAYEWVVMPENLRELRILEVGSGLVTTVWRGKAARIRPTAWSQDGRRIAGVFDHDDDRQDVFVVSASAGTAPILIATSLYAESPSFSEDGALLVFERRESLRAASTLWVANVATREAKPLALQQQAPHTPVWRGHTIVFASATGIWAAQVDPVTAGIDGVPRQLSEERSDILGVLSDGSIVCERRTGSIEVAVAGLDGAGARQISTGAGAHYSPDWAPDGNSVVWIDEPPPPPLQHLVRLHSFDFDAAADRSLDNLAPPGNLIGANPRFSPDGARILLRTSENGFFTFDPHSGEFSRPLFAHRNYGDIEWDDEGHVFVLDFDRGVARVDLANGREEWVYRVSQDRWMGRGIAVTRDRNRIAFVLMSGPGQNVATIMIMNRDGSAARPLLTRTRDTATFRLQQFAASPLLLGEWTPGGELLFAATDVLPNGFVEWDTDLWAIPADGGQPRKTGLSARGLRDIRPDPAGSRVLYTMFDVRFDTWVLKGLLDPQILAR